MQKIRQEICFGTWNVPVVTLFLECLVSHYILLFWFLRNNRSTNKIRRYFHIHCRRWYGAQYGKFSKFLLILILFSFNRAIILEGFVKYFLKLVASDIAKNTVCNVVSKCLDNLGPCDPRFPNLIFQPQKWHLHSVVHNILFCPGSITLTRLVTYLCG